MIVVDASVLVTALVDDNAEGDRLRERLWSESIAAPALIDIEVISAIRSLVSGGWVTDQRAADAVSELQVAPIEYTNHGSLLRRIWELRHNLTPYDAAYVALAEANGFLLLTSDARLARAPGITCAVEVMAEPPESGSL